MNGMIERRAGGAQDAPAALGVAQATPDLIGKRRLVDQMRTGGHEEEAAARDQWGRQPHQLAIALRADLEVLAALHESRRIADHHVVLARHVAAQLLERVEGLALLEADDLL